jgi:putative protein-disulfide isomerase
MTPSPDTKILYYVFDPLCGWCYAAMPALAAVENRQGIQIDLLPAGLFTGTFARKMDDTFAAYAWSNDQRIGRLTGQRFTSVYRSQVLADRVQPFDSGPATTALTAVALTAPDRQLAALDAIQRARYVEGRDVTSISTLTRLLASEGLTAAAAMLSASGSDLTTAVQERMQHAQHLMRQFNVRGVPAMIVEFGNQLALIDHAPTYGNPLALTGLLQAACSVPYPASTLASTRRIDTPHSHDHP